MKDYEAIHANNLKRYQKQIASIYRKAAEEMAGLGISVRGAKVPFSFDDYPEVKKLVDKLLKDLAAETSAVIVNGVRAEFTLANNNVNGIANLVYIKGKGAEILTGAESAEWFRRYTSTSMVAAEKFVERKIAGLNLSDRVWKTAQQFRTDVEISLEQGIAAGRSAAEMTADVKAALNDPSRLFRRVRQPDGTLRLSEAAKNYHPGQGVYRSSYKNALRLTGTETNIAYRTGFHERIQEQDWITGIEVRLSNNHTCKDGKGGLIQGWTDICDDLAGEYPKTFKFTGWHPACYDMLTEVCTFPGKWKLFKDVLPEDLIMSLNPETRKIGWVGISDVQAKNYSGKMVHFKSKQVDCLVTQDHPMLRLNHYERITRTTAKLFSPEYDRFYLCGKGKNTFVPLKRVKRKTIDYSGIVYDLTLERNHIMYVRRNGKCFWGSNCRCEQLIINQDPVQAMREFKAGISTAKQLEDLPPQFNDWMDRNAERVDGARERGTLPYFLRDNEKLLNP